MTPPPADPVPLPEPCRWSMDEYEPWWTRDDLTTYGDSRERAGLARGVAEERARVVAWLRGIVNPMPTLPVGPQQQGWQLALNHAIDDITRGDHERTPNA